MKAKKILRWLGQADQAIQSWLEIPGQPQGINISQEPCDSAAPLGQPHLNCGPTDTVLVNDVSGSMGNTDCQPSRLEASKQAAQEYVRQRVQRTPGDRIAVVAFSDFGEVILPLTTITRLDFITQGIKKLKVGGGTDLGAGLREAEKIHLPEGKIALSAADRNQQILLQTDGHGGNPIRIAKRLKEHGVLIEVIGVGGDPSAVNEDLLRKVATTDASGITHYRFIHDAEQLVNHYRQLATGIVMREDS